MSVTFTLQLHVVARTNHPAPHSIGYFPTGITDRTLAKQITRFETTRNRREFVRSPLGNSGSLQNQVARRDHFFFLSLSSLRFIRSSSRKSRRRKCRTILLGIIPRYYGASSTKQLARGSINAVSGAVPVTRVSFELLRAEKIVAL